MAQEAGIDILFIDTPGTQDMVALEYARRSHATIIPIGPHVFDTWSVSQVLEMLPGDNFMFVLNAVHPPRGMVEARITRDARQQINDAGFQIARQAIVKRDVFNDAHEMGYTVLEYDPGGRAAIEIRRVWQEIKARFIDGAANG